MKKLIAVLMLVASSGLFGADVSELNIVNFEKELRAAGIEYVRIINENIAGKRALLDHANAHPAAPVDTTTPADDDVKADASTHPVEEDSVEDVPAADAGDDSSGSGVVETKGVLGADIQKIYDDAGLKAEDAVAIEKEVESEYSAKDKGQRRVGGGRIKNSIRERKIKEAKQAKDDLEQAARIAALVAASPSKVQKDLSAIFDLSVFESLIPASYDESKPILENLERYHKAAFKTPASRGTHGPKFEKLFENQIKPYLDNVLVADFLYLNLNVVPTTGFFGWVGGSRKANYKEVINTDLETKVDALKDYFGVPKKVFIS